MRGLWGEVSLLLLSSPGSRAGPGGAEREKPALGTGGAARRPHSAGLEAGTRPSCGPGHPRGGGRIGPSPRRSPHPAPPLSAAAAASPRLAPRGRCCRCPARRPLPAGGCRRERDGGRRARGREAAAGGRAVVTWSRAPAPGRAGEDGDLGAAAGGEGQCGPAPAACAPRATAAPPAPPAARPAGGSAAPRPGGCASAGPGAGQGAEGPGLPPASDPPLPIASAFAPR